MNIKSKNQILLVVTMIFSWGFITPFPNVYEAGGITKKQEKSADHFPGNRDVQNPHKKSEQRKKNPRHKDWKEINTVEEAVSAFPERIDFIFEKMDLTREGLAKTKKAYENGNIILACKYLLDYYRHSDAKKRIKKDPPQVSAETVHAADSIVNDIITIQRVSDKVPRLGNGHLDWHHTGPANDKEYAWLFNRHSAVGFLLGTWFRTGNPKYARHIYFFIKDWIISSWPYPGVKSHTAMWRGLEVTARVRNWMPAFYNLIDTEYLSPATQLLILSSIPEHAHYLRNFHGGGNWLTMEINGLATVATAWPELKKSEDWLNYAIETMTESLKEQVYPDGAQTELTSHYHYVALANFDRFAAICNTADIALPDFYTETREQMWHYLAGTMRPNGYGLLNNDADLMYNRQRIHEAASAYHRDDWEYIASNGKSGQNPGIPSFVFPWAGHIISRSDFTTDAHWSFFDTGPWGSGHQHRDKLHISLAAYGRDLLVDAGRFAYVGKVADKFRKYATGSTGHNVILIDEKGQEPGPVKTTEPLPEKNYAITDDFDYATGSFSNYTGLEGSCEHIRSLFYVRGEFWVVVDKISGSRPRKIEALWHWHPDCKVQESNGIVSTVNQHGNLAIIPAGNINWDIKLVKGREKPSIQGWYSSEYNIYEPNTTSVFSTNINSGKTLIWVLFPSEKATPHVDIRLLPEEDEGIRMRVSVQGKGHRDVFVPFKNSAKASMEKIAGEN
jgi:hypothetical protein